MGYLRFEFDIHQIVYVEVMVSYSVSTLFNRFEESTSCGLEHFLLLNIYMINVRDLHLFRASDLSFFAVNRFNLQRL